MADTLPSTNLITTANEGFVTTLGSSILSGASTVPLTSTSGLTNGTIFAGIIEPGLTKQQVFTGVVDTGGGQITGVTWVRGSNADHSAGVTIVDYVTGASHNMMGKNILTQHGQDGTHGAITATSLAATGNISSSAGIISTTAVSSLKDTGTALSTYRAESSFDYVASGGVWTADSVGVNLNASMTALVCYINGQRISIGAVTARAFTTSVDTYIDVLNTAGVGSLVYTTAVTNAASPALAANSLRIGIIQAAATITAATKVNQGQEDRVFPIASSIPYAVTDSLGNLICPRDPSRKLLGYRQITGNFTTANTTATQITGLTCPVIVPAGRKVRVSSFTRALYSGSINIRANLTVWDGIVGSGTQLNQGTGFYTATGSATSLGYTEALTTPAATSKTYNAGLHAESAATANFEGAATYPGWIKVELD